MEVNWFILLPTAALLLIVGISILARRKEFYRRLKSITRYLFLLLFLSLFSYFLKSSFITDIFYSGPLLTFLDLSLLFIILVLAVKFTVFFFFEFLVGEKQNLRYPRLIKDVVVIVLYIIGLLMIAKYYMNIDVTVALASSAVLTVVIGFALQDVLGDLFSGIALNLDEAVNIGDWIKAGEHEGRVEQFRWRAIKLRTVDNSLVLIPNRIAAKEELQRFGRGGRESFALRMRIGVSYKSSPDFVISVLEEVLNNTSQVLKDPKPMVMVDEFGDFSVVYQIKFWLADYTIKEPLMSEIRRNAWYAFKRNNIQIPFPIRDVYIKKEEGDGLTTGQVVELLKQNEIFAGIGDDQLRELAASVKIKPYGNGEVLITEGKEGQHFYQILEGQAEVLKKGRVLARLKPGDYVGEMSLFTGDKTSAEVRTTSECSLLEVASATFRETVKINAQMARELSEVIARRKAQLTEFAKKDDQSKTSVFKKETENIFLRIKKYFSF